jgi:dTDP-4-dehydrorhamnose 3,5-epimerase
MSGEARPLFPLPEVLLLERAVAEDDRGYFTETWNRARHEAAGVREAFVQDNLSFSHRGVLRGLHYQWPRAQGKLVTVLQGAVFDVAVDVRRDSPTFGKWVGEELSEANHRQLWVPPGFAHGFVVLSESALFQYKVSAPYAREDEVSVRWDDPTIGIEWPLAAPVLSPKDAVAPLLADIEESRLPQRTLAG